MKPNSRLSQILMRASHFAMVSMILLLSGAYTRGQALWNGLNPQQTAASPLQIRVSDGDLTSILGTAKFSATNIQLTASATNYVYLDLTQSPPKLTVNTTGFPSTSYYPIATVVTSTSQITSLTDSRPTFNTAIGSSGSGITPVATLPTTCTSGVTAQVSLTVAPYGVYTCVATNYWSNSPEGGSTVFATAYGVTGAGSEDCSATFTNTSGTVTLSANAVTPTSSMIGWSMQGSAGCVDTNGFQAVMPRCTITSINSGSRTLTGTGCTANANAAGTATQHVTFGPIEDTPLSAAETAGLSANTGPCPNFYLPSGFVYVTTGHFNSFTCNTQYTGAGSTGLQILGFGRVSSRLGMSSDFAFNTGCPSFNSINSCFFAKAGIVKQNMSITGFQNPMTNPTAATCVVNDGIDDFTINFGLYGGGPTLTNLNGFCMTSGGTTDSLIIEDAMGSVGMYINTTLGGHGSCYQCFSGDVAVTALSAGASSFSTFGGGWGTSAATAGVVVVPSGGTWTSIQEIFFIPAASNGVQCTGLCDIEGAYTGTLPAGSKFFSTSGTGHLRVKNSTATSCSTCGIWNMGSTGLADDDGGNTFTIGTAGQCWTATAGAILRVFQPTTTYVTNPCNFTATGYVPYRSVSGACTGTATSSATIGLRVSGSSTTGTAVVTACTNSAVVDAGNIMDHAGTLNSLQVTAATGGFNSSSGVVTVYKNGSATTITCTIGTGTSCVDMTHSVAFATGDLVTLEFTTQATETLAGVKAVIGAY